MKSKQQYLRFCLVFTAIVFWAAAFASEKFAETDPIEHLLQQAGTFLSYCENTLIPQDLSRLTQS